MDLVRIGCIRYGLLVGARGGVRDEELHVTGSERHLELSEPACDCKMRGAELSCLQFVRPITSPARSSQAFFCT
jgi:hypothetical protein